MTEETLRRWANVELSRDEARDVYRWMVRCTSPELPTLLTGLLRERREREADAALRQRGSTWPELVQRWAQLLADGAASWTEPGLMPMPASVDDEAPRPQVWLEERDGATRVRVDIEEDAEVTVFVTDDDGGAVRLPEASGRPREWVLPRMGARPTVWVAMGTASTPEPADVLEQLAQRTDDDDVAVVALRWTDRQT